MDIAKIAIKYWRVFMSSRELAVSGAFYPQTCQEIKKYMTHFNTILKQNNINLGFKNTRAIIAPHAGYIYSGFSANLAYKSIDDCENIKRVVVIGPSHRVYVEGVSVAKFDNYPSPCGDLSIDIEFSKKLLEDYPFASFNPQAHNEHSTETQIPFIKEYLPNTKVVEIVYGKIEYELLSRMISEILEDSSTFLVISTDLSHFHNLQKAKELDNICLNAIIKKELALFDSGCEACGLIGVKALMQVAKKINLSVNFLDYRTSFDATKDDKSVVGYTSFILTKENSE